MREEYIKKYIEDEPKRIYEQLLRRAKFWALMNDISSQMSNLAAKNLRPERIFVSREDEVTLSCSGDLIGDEIDNSIFIEGIRAVLPSILGLIVIWDAEETKVLPGEEYEAK